MTPKPAGGTGRLPSGAVGLFVSTGTHGSTYCRTTPPSAAPGSARNWPARSWPARSWPARTTRPLTARAAAISNGRRTPARAERPKPDVQPGNGGHGSAPPWAGRADLELALGAWHPCPARGAFWTHRGRIRPSRTRLRRGGRAGGRRSSAAVLATGPPMVHRPRLVPHHAAPGPGRVGERLGADQGRQAAVHPGDHAHGLRRAGARLAARRPYLRRPAG